MRAFLMAHAAMKGAGGMRKREAEMQGAPKGWKHERRVISI